jgi:nucleotide-binding universal stress UspA family protein
MLYGQLTIAATGETTPLLIGNIVSISVGAGVVLVGSLMKPENFNFEVMKQRILVVDDKIRSIIEKDTDDSQLRLYAKLTRRYSIALSLVLVVVWPLPLYFSGFVFTLHVYTLWVGLAVAWASISACVIVLLPLIESRAGILKVIKRIANTSSANAKRYAEKDLNLRPKQKANQIYYPEDANINAQRALVAIDGSLSSLRALSYAASLFKNNSMVRIYLIHVMEWTDEEDESVDSAIVTQMELEGRRLLKGLAMSPPKSDYERIVKLGDPATKIAEVAERLEVDLIIMGTKGLGRAQGNIGNVSGKVLQLTSKPVILIK